MTTAAEGVTAALNREAAERLAAGEPQWLRERRLAAWEVYEQTPLPTTQVEEWRYTDVAMLKLDEVQLEEEGGGAPSGPAAALLAPGAEAAGRVLQVGARLVEVEGAEELRAKGVVIADLATAAREQPELVEPYLGT